MDNNLKLKWNGLNYNWNTPTSAVPLSTITVNSSKQQIWTPKEPRLQNYQMRVKSFKQWSFENVLPATILALAGFHKCPGTSDEVICYYCGLRCRGWSMVDNPISEHIRHDKTCLHIQTIANTSEDTSYDTVH
jgi:hypothetical protein